MSLLNCSNKQINNIYNIYRYISDNEGRLIVDGRHHSGGHNNDIVIDNLYIYVIKIKDKVWNNITRHLHGITQHIKFK